MEKETNPVIMLRDLKEEDFEAIEHIKNRFDIKANTKAVNKILSEYLRLYALCESQKDKISNLEDDLYQKNDDLQTIKFAFVVIENIKYSEY